jgi:hypothetical protein
MELSASAFIA